MIYFDTSYLVRLYLEDAGFEAVRSLLSADKPSSSLHGRAETLAAFHRGHREDRYSRKLLGDLIGQFEADCRANRLHWLQLDETLVATLANNYRALPPGVFLRSADALHLACARENGFKAVYSNDKHLLAAAPRFGLEGRNIIQ